MVLEEGGGFRPLQISAVDEGIETKICTQRGGPMMNTFQKKFQLVGLPAPPGPYFGPKWAKITCLGEISADCVRGALGPPFFVKGVTDICKKI